MTTMPRFQFHAPSSLEEAFALLADRAEGAKLIAGGTALLILLKQHLVSPEHLISVQNIHELAGISRSNGALRIGASATHRQVETAQAVTQHLPVLAATLQKVATVRIRNVATMGGNLAHADPALDPPVTLVALDASVEIVSQAGQRRVPLDQFFVDYYETVLQPTEVLSAVHVPLLPERSSAAFIKFVPRTVDDYATVAVAARLALDDAGTNCSDVRVAIGAAGSTTIRATAAEAALRGERADEASFREAAAIAKSEVDPITDVRGSADYKRTMVDVFVRRVLMKALEELQQSQGNS